MQDVKKIDGVWCSVNKVVSIEFILFRKDSLASAESFASFFSYWTNFECWSLEICCLKSVNDGELRNIASCFGCVICITQFMSLGKGEHLMTYHAWKIKNHKESFNKQLDLRRLEKIYLIFFFGTNFIFLFVVIIRGEVSDYFYLHYDVSCVP